MNFAKGQLNGTPVILQGVPEEPALRSRPRERKLFSSPNWRDTSKRGQVRLLPKQPRLPLGAVEHMMRLAADQSWSTSWHFPVFGDSIFSTSITMTYLPFSSALHEAPHGTISR